MAKDNKYGVTLSSLRRSIKALKKNDPDSTWSLKSRDLCCETYMALPKKHMVRIAEEVPIDGLFTQDLFRSIQQAGYANMESLGRDGVFIRAIEEMSELTQALTKSMREKEDLDNIKEEIADVENCLIWIKQAFNLETDSTIQKLQYLKAYRELVRFDKISSNERDSKMTSLLKTKEKEKEK